MLGGEPTIHPQFFGIVRKVKELNLGIAVHTNGTNPQAVKKLIQEKLVDYFAMDIKTAKDEYQKVIDIKQDMDKIQESINLIMNSGTDYEFRTTVVPGLIEKNQMEKIGKWLSGAKKYYIQQFRPGNTLNPSYNNKKPYMIPELEDLKKIAKKYLKNVEIRGV